MRHLLLLALLSALPASAQETAVGFTGADSTLYVSPTGGGTCSSSAPCTCSAAAARVHNTPLLQHSVRYKAAAGTYGSSCAMDLWAVPVNDGAFVSFEGTPTRAALDGGIAAGICDWTTGASPERSTCGAGADGGWAPGGLIPFWARFGPTSATFPDGTCGTYLVESNTPSTMTLEVGSGTNATLPSACTGPLAFEVLDTGTILGGLSTPVPPSRHPQGTTGLPDGGPLNSVVAIAETRGSGLTVRAPASGQGAASAVVRWVRLDPGGVEANGVKVAQGAGVTLDHVRCDTTSAGTVPGACVALMGDNRVTVQHTQVLRREDAGTGGTLAISRLGATPGTLKVYSSTARGATWGDLRSPETRVAAAYTFSDGAPDSPWLHNGMAIRMQGDRVRDAGTNYMFSYGADFFGLRPALHGQFVSPSWRTEAAAGATVLSGGYGSTWVFEGSPDLSFPYASVLLCADQLNSYELAGGVYNAGDAGALADFTLGCSRTSTRTWAQVDAGSAGAYGAHAMCGGYDPADGGGVVNPRAGCVVVP